MLLDYEAFQNQEEERPDDFARPIGLDVHAKADGEPAILRPACKQKVIYNVKIKLGSYRGVRPRFSSAHHSFGLSLWKPPVFTLTGAVQEACYSRAMAKAVVVAPTETTNGGGAVRRRSKRRSVTKDSPTRHNGIRFNHTQVSSGIFFAFVT